MKKKQPRREIMERKQELADAERASAVSGDEVFRRHVDTSLELQRKMNDNGKVNILESEIRHSELNDSTSLMGIEYWVGRLTEDKEIDNTTMSIQESDDAAKEETATPDGALPEGFYHPGGVEERGLITNAPMLRDEFADECQGDIEKVIGDSVPANADRVFNSTPLGVNMFASSRGSDGGVFSARDNVPPVMEGETKEVTTMDDPIEEYDDAAKKEEALPEVHGSRADKGSEADGAGDETGRLEE